MTSEQKKNIKRLIKLRKKAEQRLMDYDSKLEKAFQMAIDGKADVVEVKHGEWIEDKTHISKRRKKYVCSNCLHYITIKTTTDINSRRYCYECGAKMKIKEN